MRARLQATSQEARTADELASSLKEQRAVNERERQSLQLQSGLRDDLNAQLRAAIALESERCAKAWAKCEKLQREKQARDDGLEEARTELEGARAKLGAATDELRELREARRLSEVLLRGAEKRESLKAAAIEYAQGEASRLAADKVRLSSKLESLQGVELAAKESALDAQRAELASAKLSVETRDERVGLLRDELARRADEIERLTAELALREEEKTTLVEGELRQAEEARDAALASARLAAFEAETASEAAARLQRRLEGRDEEVGARGEQLRLAHEANMLLTLETTLKDERLRSVEEALEVERARAAREVAVVKQLRSEGDTAHASVLELSREVARQRENGTSLEMRLSQRDTQLFALIEDLKSAEVRGETREQRMALLRSRAKLAAQEREAFDSGLGRLNTRLGSYEAELQQTREESRLLAAEVALANAEKEAHRAEAVSLRTAAYEAAGRLSARDEQLAAMSARLATAREDLHVQLAMIEEEVRGTQHKLDAKDVALQLQMEDATAREEEAHGFMAEVSERLARAHGAMQAKDDLLATLESKLREALGALGTTDEQAAVLRRESAAAKRETHQTAAQLETLEERHSLMAADFAVATEALDNYRDTLVSAELRMAHDRDKVQALQLELRDLHAHLQSGATAAHLPADVLTPTGTGGEGGAAGAAGDARPTSSAALALPPLTSGADAGASRVHYLYFLSSLLLIKNALSQQGQMANVGAQEVFDEIVRNAVPLEEWPTYIFTRLFSARGTADQEVAALKAVAKKQQQQQSSASCVAEAKKGALKNPR